MKKKMYLMLMAALMVASVPAMAGVINVDFEINGDLTPNTGDSFHGGAGFTTGTDTPWNSHYVGRDARWRGTSTSGPLATMDGSATTYDVMFELGGSYHVNSGGYVYLDSGMTRTMTYSGLVPGNSYDVRFFSYRNQARFTFGENTQDTGWYDSITTFTGLVADENGVIEGTWERNPSGANHRIYGTQIQGEFVPEPATIALLGLGGLVLRRRRKA